MSRIREALKKAALERDVQQGGRTTQELVELAGESLVREVGSQLVQTAAVRTVEAPATPFPADYERLLKKCQRTMGKVDPRHSVFVNESLEPGGAERFRTLRSRLYQIAATRPLKRVLVTSSVPSEGKTTVAANLAHSIMCQPDRRVLLIDADLRCSGMHELLGAPGGPGLTDYLRGEAEKEAVIQNGLEGNLCFIPGGSEVSNPSELLLGDRMKKLLDLVTPIFDWIILDSPPALAVHDASSLADLCDGVLFVVKAGKTDHQLAERASSEFLKKNLLGVVLNGVEIDASYGGYYSGYATDDQKDSYKE